MTTSQIAASTPAASTNMPIPIARSPYRLFCFRSYALKRTLATSLAFQITTSPPSFFPPAVRPCIGRQSAPFPVSAPPAARLPCCIRRDLDDAVPPCSWLFEPLLHCRWKTPSRAKLLMRPPGNASFAPCRTRGFLADAEKPAERLDDSRPRRSRDSLGATAGAGRDRLLRHEQSCRRFPSRHRRHSIRSRAAKARSN